MGLSRRSHPLALLFWSQIVLAYGLPVGLAVAYRIRGEIGSPGRTTLALCEIYPFMMVASAAMLVMADARRIYVYVVQIARRLPGVVVGGIYAVAAFIVVMLARSADSNMTIAWADYVVGGRVTGINALLLLLVIEIFAVVGLACQMVEFVRRWRRLSRLAATSAKTRSPPQGRRSVD